MLFLLLIDISNIRATAGDLGPYMPAIDYSYDWTLNSRLEPVRRIRWRRSAKLRYGSLSLRVVPEGLSSELPARDRWSLLVE